MATGCLPIRDMITSKPGVSEHAAQHLAAHIGSAGFVVGQNAARGRQDRDAEPAIDARQIDKLRIDPPPRPAAPPPLPPPRPPPPASPPPPPPPPPPP